MASEACRTGLAILAISLETCQELMPCAGLDKEDRYMAIVSVTFSAGFAAGDLIPLWRASDFDTVAPDLVVNLRR